MNADHTDDMALLANTPTQAESLLHSMELAAVGTGLQINVDKTDFRCFNQRVNISTLNGGSLKLVDKFIYQGSSVSSTENNINTRLVKAWTAINRLSVIWKSDQSNKIKCNFFQTVVVSHTTIWMHHIEADRVNREKARRQLNKNAMSYIPGSDIPQSSSCTATSLPSQKPKVLVMKNKIKFYLKLIIC